MRYDEQRFRQELAALVAPPYDVIQDAEQDALYARHPHNIVRVDLNRIHPEDHDEDNRYTRSRRHLMDWLARGVLRLEAEPALYVHHQRFDAPDGSRVTRRGFIGLVRLAEYAEGVVLPHERTLRGPKADRLALMKATESNLSQVFMLYDDPQLAIDAALEEAVARTTPLMELTTEDGIEHLLWAVSDDAPLASIAQALADQQLLIADGHHRYETALAYRDFRRSVAERGDPHDPDAPHEFVMTFLVNMRDPGLLVFPTHRVVHSLPQLDAEALIRRLEADPLYAITRLDAIPREDGAALSAACQAAGERSPSFILLAPSLRHAVLVRFLGDASSPIFDEETPPQVRALDVAILHEGLLDRALGISKADQEAMTHLRYIKKLDEALATLSDPDTQLLVLMNATPVEQVNAVCRSGGKMPQKSTFFAPKILSGLLINPL